ncbi:hypothetical protein PMIN01_01050 [Paraphaeosphaeria minitans]|uniref:Uncharacterized protein n=1 Tax=Paraphaeosphaeria minitans TaxID=565426 RepID=A0A9P6GU91_9PLEO|nr:hypothetical protein PMIN01_01050 [Paraphaeosphaeria minitans]
MFQPNRVFKAARHTTPDLSTTVSGSESDIPAMLSDGKRMRVVWRPEHGDGEHMPHIVERTKSTLRGHPTWKFFVDDIIQPIVRGSQEEPPRHVYLDDEACYIIWKSQQYTDTELKTYWPFDFDHQGNIKTGRSNRGRPAWVDSDIPVIAKGKLRGKNKWYEFSGEPETTEYRPVRPANKSKMELQVETEWGTKNGQDVGLVNPIEETLDTLTSETSANKNTVPRSTALTISAGPQPRFDPTRRARPPEESLKVKDSRSYPVQGLSLDKLPHHIEHTYHTAVSQSYSLRNSNAPPKRKFVGSFLISSSSLGSNSRSPDRKHVKLAELPPTTVGASPKHKSAGPFLISSSPIGNSSRHSDPKRVTSAKLSLPVVGASLDDKHGGREEHRSIPLPAQLPEFPLDDSTEEDEFLDSE